MTGRPIFEHIQRFVIPFSAVERFQHPGVEGTIRVRQLKQRHTRAQLPGIGIAEDGPGIALGLVQQCLGDLPQIADQHRIGSIPPGFLHSVQTVVMGRFAPAEPPELGEDIPHPVAGLKSPAHLRQGNGVIMALGVVKSLHISNPFGNCNSFSCFLSTWHRIVNHISHLSSIRGPSFTFLRSHEEKIQVEQMCRSL